MKALKVTILAIVSLSVFIQYAYCDVGPSFKPHKFYEKISNIDEFPGISFIAYFHHFKKKAYLIKQNQPLSHDQMSLRGKRTIYAAKTSYIKGKDLSTIDFPSDPNCIELYGDMKFHLSSYWSGDTSEGCREIDVIYSILGFRNGKLIIYKSKEIYKYGFFTPDKTITFDKPDTTGIIDHID